PTAAREASRHCAFAQIHISPDDRAHEMCISPVWGSPTDEQLDQLPRTAVVTVTASAGTYLRQMATSSQPEARVRTVVDTGWRQTPILVADFLRPNAGPQDPFVLFTGH